MEQTLNSSSFQTHFIHDSDASSSQNLEKENKISRDKDATRNSDKDTTASSVNNQEQDSESDNDFSLYLGWIYFLLGIHLLIFILSVTYVNAAGIVDGLLGSAACLLMVFGLKRTNTEKVRWAKHLFAIETLAIIFLICSYNKNMDLSYLDNSNSEQEHYNEEEPITPLIDAGKGAIIVLIHLVFNVYAAHRTERSFKQKEDQIKEKFCNDSVSTTI